MQWHWKSLRYILDFWRQFRWSKSQPCFPNLYFFCSRPPNCNGKRQWISQVRKVIKQLTVCFGCRFRGFSGSGPVRPSGSRHLGPNSSNFELIVCWCFAFYFEFIFWKVVSCVYKKLLWLWSSELDECGNKYLFVYYSCAGICAWLECVMYNLLDLQSWLRKRLFKGCCRLWLLWEENFEINSKNYYINYLMTIFIKSIYPSTNHHCSLPSWENYRIINWIGRECSRTDNIVNYNEVGIFLKISYGEMARGLSPWSPYKYLFRIVDK